MDSQSDHLTSLIVIFGDNGVASTFVRIITMNELGCYAIRGFKLSIKFNPKQMAKLEMQGILNTAMIN